jgi:hypothetical protein
MTGIERTIHIIPLGHEIDRAVIPFEQNKADKVYLLTVLEGTTLSEAMSEKQRRFTESVRNQLQAKGIEVVCQHVNLFDLPDLMKTISKIIVTEQSDNNRIFINMSAAGRLTSVAATLVGMAHDVQVYYVHADGYPEDEGSRQLHGLSICTTRKIDRLTNFRFVMPDDVGLTILLFLTKTGKRERFSTILKILRENTTPGFEDDFTKIEDDKRRSVQSRQLMKLDKTILARLERNGFIERKKDGRSNYVHITESGKYAAHISGRLD